MRRKFLAKALSKTAVLGVMLSLACSSGVFAYQSSHVSGSAPVRGGYMDDYNVSHSIEGNVNCSGTIAWEEGIACWVVDATFDASASIDGAGVSLDASEPITIRGNVAYRRFKINNSNKYVKGILTCDDYGDSSISGTVE